MIGAGSGISDQVHLQHAAGPWTFDVALEPVDAPLEPGIGHPERHLVAYSLEHDAVRLRDGQGAPMP